MKWWSVSTQQTVSTRIDFEEQIITFSLRANRPTSIQRYACNLSNQWYNCFLSFTFCPFYRGFLRWITIARSTGCIARRLSRYQSSGRHCVPAAVHRKRVPAHWSRHLHLHFRRDDNDMETRNVANLQRSHWNVHCEYNYVTCVECDGF